ncbi:glycosyltransferase family A protein [Neogemmobacter tilapiae]|uniref:Uncharacterized protein n=1 Tax=Neogemmobacter tilapiae TaxID=875041 RepID=A0A918WHR6_9RHOB|nr:glycosyltransferase family A protein [Gemmobacter tilapiae]GHC47632.1 hypothetical protein GCM10007315_06840 [Gemmobacter tilapiae]
MTRPTYITLSSIPPRFPFLGPILQTLVDQQGASAPVLLFIPESYRRFPDWDGTLPKVPAGVTIVRCAQDHGPATKVLPALQRFAGQEVNILFCDDDNLYPADWLATFLLAAQDRPEVALCAHGAELNSLFGRTRPPHRLPRAERWETDELAAHLTQSRPPLPLAKPLFKSSGFTDTLLGRGGVLICPKFFDSGIFDLPPVIWTVDDFWLSGHLELRDIPIWVDHRIPNPMTHPCMHLVRPLLHDTIENHDRWAANKACVNWFRQEKGIWQPGAPDEISSGRPRTTIKKPRPKPPTLRQRLRRRLKRLVSGR